MSIVKSILRREDIARAFKPDLDYLLAAVNIFSHNGSPEESQKTYSLLSHVIDDLPPYNPKAAISVGNVELIFGQDSQLFGNYSVSCEQLDASNKKYLVFSDLSHIDKNKLAVRFGAYERTSEHLALEINQELVVRSVGIFTETIKCSRSLTIGSWFKFDFSLSGRKIIDYAPKITFNEFN